MNERISRIVKHPSFIPVTVSFVSMGVGIGIGFILGHRTSRNVHVIPAQKPLDYEELEAFLEEAEAKVKEQNADGQVKERGVGYEEEIVVSNEPTHDPADRIAYGAEMVAKTLEREMTSTHKAEPDVVSNVEFANDSEWNLELELASRNSNRPYVIHHDEFFAKEMEDAGYIQTTLTYYEGDNILTDEEEHPIYDMSIVGEFKFGHGSKGDPNVFYVRNDKRKGEYEIVRDPGHYLEEVMDLENGGERAKRLSHGKVDRFRPDD